MNRGYSAVRLAARLTAPARNRRRRIFSLADVCRIWVHKPDHLGDYLLARAAISMLRAAWPPAHIVVACHPAARPLAELDGRQTYAWSSPFLGGTGRLRDYRRAVRSFRPDLLVNLRHDWRDMLLCTTLGAPYVVSPDHRGAASLATHVGSPPDEKRPEAQNHAALLYETLGLPLIAAPPLPLPDAICETARHAWDETPGDGSRIALHAAARTAAKTWPAAYWRELIGLLRERYNARMILLGGTDDRAFNRLVAADIAGAVDVAGRYGIAEAAALIAHADLLVGVDSGPAHLARAVGTPVVTIMSGANVTTRWAADPDTALTHPVACAPCRRERCPVPRHPCLSGLRPIMVMETIERVRAR